MNTHSLLAQIQAAGLPTLRLLATVAVLYFGAIGVAIYRSRHELFDSDPEVMNDTPAVRHVRLEAVVLVWSGVMLALLAILLQVWLA